MTPDPGAAGRRYQLAFLTDEWEWEVELSANTFEDAKAASRAALENLVLQEQPGLACVTVLENGVKIGVWDWVGRQACWTLF